MLDVGIYTFLTNQGHWKYIAPGHFIVLSLLIFYCKHFVPLPKQMFFVPGLDWKGDDAGVKIHLNVCFTHV